MEGETRLTLNYGLRYDIEFTPTFAPANALNAAAEQAENVVEGIPVDPNNIQPRIGFAWDPTGSGKTVVRGGYGIYYDHPLLAIAFNSTTADGTRNSQLILPGGAATGVPLALDPFNFNASSIFQGVLNTTGIAEISYLGSQQRFDPFNSPFFNNQNYLAAGFPLTLLPFTFPVAKSFVYGYAQQASLGIERDFSHDWKIGATYNWTHGTHLNRPRDINSPDNALLVGNYDTATAIGLVATGSSPYNVGIPDVAAGTCVPTGAGAVLVTVPVFLGKRSAMGPARARPSDRWARLRLLITFAPRDPIHRSRRWPGDSIIWWPSRRARAIRPGRQARIPTSLEFLIVASTSRNPAEARCITRLRWWCRSASLMASSCIRATRFRTRSTIRPTCSRFSSPRTTVSQIGNARIPHLTRSRWITSAVFTSPYKNSDEGIWKKLLANSYVSPIMKSRSEDRTRC